MRNVRVGQLLECEPALAVGMTAEERAIAEQALPVQLASVGRGPWQPQQEAPDAGHLGFLVIKGFLIRRIEVGAGSSVELLGRGDLLRPWQEDVSSFCAPSWEVIEPATLVPLSPRVTRSLGQWPTLVSNLIARVMRRSRAVAADAAIASIVGLEERLLRLLWQLAETFGRVERDGVRLSVRLPHRLLAEMTAARRPSVTKALSDLQAAGKLAKTSEGSWLLLGEPPG